MANHSIKKGILKSLITALTLTFTFSGVPFSPVKAVEPAAKVYWSSESTNTQPKSSQWYSNTANAMSGVTYQLSRQTDITLTNPSTDSVPVLKVDPSVQYQNIIGMGSSLEEATIYNISRMSADKRDEVLRKLVDPVNGAGMNLIRITLGASDFTSREFYTYNDIPTNQTDPNITNFSIQKDIDFNIIATLKRALELYPNIKIFASSWSAPAWMKTNKSLIGGNLDSQYINSLAIYYRKAIQAYKDQGIPIYAMTIQNEPLYAAPDYPSMLLNPQQEKDLALAMSREFKSNNLNTKLWSYDHNFSQAWEYIPGVLGSKESGFTDAYNAVDGIAFHDYHGDPITKEHDDEIVKMSQIKEAYPDKNVMITERTVWGTAGANRIALYFRNWASSYDAWVTMLDTNIAPEKWSGTPDPTMLIQNASDVNEYWTTPEYNMLAQFSKYVKRGAKRISSNYGSDKTVTNVSFLNPDNTIVTVVINQTDSSQPFKIVSEGKEIQSTLPAKTVGTYIWPRQGSDLLTNADFEQGNLNGWTGWSSSSTSAQKVDNDQPYNSDYKLTHWANTDYQQSTSQTKQIPNGTYKVSVWVRSSGGQNQLRVFAKNYGAQEVTTEVGTAPVEQWKQYIIDNIQVTNGQIEIGVWSDANANNWAVFDNFKLELKDHNLLLNAGFEVQGDLYRWKEWFNGSRTWNNSIDMDNPYQGTYKLTHYSTSAYQQMNNQVKTVPNGTYKVSVWVRSGGGQNILRLFAKNYGGTELTSEISSAGINIWRQYTIDNIQVTNGTIEIGVYSDANANNWATFDNFELIKN
jgi:glucosylceramidase